MGSCFSRRKRKSSPEQLEHRSSQESGTVESTLPPRAEIQRIIRVVAALQAKKLPSQDQISHCIQFLLRSDILRTAELGDPRCSPLSDNGRSMLKDIREVMESSLRLGLEKNNDNLIQSLVYHYRKIGGNPIQADFFVNTDHTNHGETVLEVATEALPSQGEVSSDTRTLVQSVFTLLRLLVSSSGFRVILSDLFTSAREVLADTAATVGEVSAQVEKIAEKVEEVVRPDGLSGVLLGAARTNAGAARAPGNSQSLGDDALSTAQQESDYREALVTIIQLFRKYSDHLAAATFPLSTSSSQPAAKPHPPALAPVVWTDDPHLSKAISGLGTLLSRLAGGRPVDPIIESMYTVVWDIFNLPIATPVSQTHLSAKNFFRNLDQFLEQTLNNPRFIRSPQGHQQLEELYDHAKAIVISTDSDTSNLVQDIRALVEEVDIFISALESDRTTSKFITRISNLSSSLYHFISTAISSSNELPKLPTKKAKDLTHQARRDIFTWFLPRLLRVLRYLPVPRVEYKDHNLEAVVDTFLLTSSLGSSLLPDHVRFTSYNDVVLDFTAANMNSGPMEHQANPLSAPPSPQAPLGSSSNPPSLSQKTQSHSFSRARIHLDGIRISARDIGYYFSYKLGLFRATYSDSGLLDINVGVLDEAQGGVSIILEVEYETDSGRSGSSAEASHAGGDIDLNAYLASPVFKVTNVHVDIPHLHFRLSHSKHRFLNTLLIQPLARPIARAFVGYYLSRQVWEGLGWLASFCGKVKIEAMEGRGAGRGVKLNEQGENRVKEELETLTFEDYRNAFLRVLRRSSKAVTKSSESNDEPSSDAHDANERFVGPRTHTTMKGIIRSTYRPQHRPSVSNDDQRRSLPCSPQPEPETLLAVGIAPQILPGKGGPHHQNEGVEDLSVQGVTREAMNDLQGLVGNKLERARGLAETAGEVREEAEELLVDVRNGNIRTELEAAKVGEESVTDGGWRSEAFDF